MRILDRFSTRGYPAAERTDIWRKHLSETLFVADYRALSAEGIVSEHAAIGVDAGRLHSFTSNGHVVDLTASGAQAPPSGRSAPILYFTTVLTGRAMYWSNSAMEIAEPGDTLVYDPADPFFMSFHDRTRLLMFESRGGDFPLAEEWGERPCLRLRAGGDGGPGENSDELRRIHAGLQHGARVETGLAAAVDRVIPALERTAREAIAPGYYSCAVDYVEERLADPGLNVRALAEAVHLSVRQLGRVFGERGTSPSRYIIQRRMRHAAQLLGAGDRTVQQVAAACGYGSVSHFSRAFSAHTGQSPQAYSTRERAGAPTRSLG